MAAVSDKFATFVGMKVVVDDKIPYIKGKIETLAEQVVYKNGGDICAADVKDADILIVRTRTRCNRELLEGSRVSLVVTATIGYDHIDTDYMREAGIRWTNCAGCNASSVRQYVHNSLIVAGMLRQGLTVGVVGVGHVGSLVAADLAEVGMRVLCCDPPLQAVHPDYVSLEHIAAEADIITFHTPLTREGDCPTFHLADRAFFDSLQRRPLIINSSRGEVVDNVALIHALDSGLVGGAVIDTWEGEPNLNMELLQRAIIATPHIAGYSADGKANATRMALQAVCQHIGKPFSLDIRPDELPAHRRPTSDNPDERALQLYNPLDDSARLKLSPDRFEWLRGNYPLRREECE